MTSMVHAILQKIQKFLRIILNICQKRATLHATIRLGNQMLCKIQETIFLIAYGEVIFITTLIEMMFEQLSTFQSIFLLGTSAHPISIILFQAQAANGPTKLFQANTAHCFTQETPMEQFLLLDHRNG